MLHDTADDDVALLVAQSINVQLDGAIEVLVDQHRLVWVNLHGGVDVPAAATRRGTLGSQLSTTARQRQCARDAVGVSVSRQYLEAATSKPENQSSQLTF